MGKALRAMLCAGFLVGFSFSPALASEPADEQIRQIILIRDSIANYPGNCPCPYNADSAGRRCCKRSAYSKPGGHAPLCYSQDVTKEMIERYRETN